MNNQPMSNRTPGGDPLLVASVDAATQRRGSLPVRRQHPARGARAIALAASVVATGAVAATLAYSEGALVADSEAEVTAIEPSDQLASAVPTVDSSAAAAPETTSTATPSTTTPSDTTPSDTTPATTELAAVAAEQSGFADGVYVGTAEYTEWGDVQVQVTISAGGIVEVAALEYPSSRKSSAINGQAIPMLEADAIATQSADLDIVSGATYTSRTYADSLQAALDQAALIAIQTAQIQASS